MKYRGKFSFYNICKYGRLVSIKPCLFFKYCRFSLLLNNPFYFQIIYKSQHLSLCHEEFVAFLSIHRYDVVFSYSGPSRILGFNETHNTA